MGIASVGREGIRSEGTEPGEGDDGDHRCSWDPDFFLGALASIATNYELDFQKFVIKTEDWNFNMRSYCASARFDQRGKTRAG